MYSKLLLSLFLSCSLFGCLGKSYSPKQEKEPSFIEEPRLPSSVQETVGRYRKEL